MDTFFIDISKNRKLTNFLILILDIDTFLECRHYYTAVRVSQANGISQWAARAEILLGNSCDTSSQSLYLEDDHIVENNHESPSPRLPGDAWKRGSGGHGWIDEMAEASHI